MMKPILDCRWVTDRLLVRTHKATKLTLSQRLLRVVHDAEVACVVNLMSKAEYLRNAAADDAQHGPSPVFMCHAFWPEPGGLPTARQVRQAINWIEDAHALGLRVLLNGVGHPARAAIAAGCWRAREGYESADRLDWLEIIPTTDGRPAPTSVLSVTERTFVTEWPTAREGQPELADMTWLECDEVFPFASVEHWLRVLPTVRVHAGVRGRVHPADVPVLDGQRVSDGVDINLDVDELRQGVWIGERTLRLTTGWQVVFVSPQR